jgi:hypothetical protein
VEQKSSGFLRAPLRSSEAQVVGDNDGCGTVGDRIGKDFPWMNLCFIDKPNSNNSGGNDFICTIDGYADEVLLLVICKMGDKR